MNKKIEQKTLVREGDTGKRLDLFIADFFDLTRNQAQNAIKNGEVLVNNVIVNKPKLEVKTNDEIIYKKRAKEAIKVEIPIIFEDEYLFVINKPSGITVHPAPGENEETVIEFFRDKLSFPNLEERDGVVHRLDKGTSGVMVMAKNPEIEAKLQQEFKDRKVNKFYIALINGAIEPDEGEIDIPVGRDEINREKMTVLGDGKPAVTFYKTVRKYRNHSLLELNPKTGRTHQLRVHLSAIGHPIVGDRKYGENESKINRIFLHAKSIEFDHPVSGKKVNFEAELPSELNTILEELK